MKTTLFTMKMPDDLLEKLRKIAKDKYVSISAIIKQVLSDYLKTLK